jgi:arabinan endo-1,5-alpha-L-arabinosidase
MRAGVAALLSLLAGCASIEPAATYRNPLTAAEFADPAVLRAPDGWYYAYATQGAPAGRMLNIQVARSRDLARWDLLGDALPEKPAWGARKQWFWAPHVLYDAQRRTYFLYYSAEPDDARGKCLAVATSKEPRGPFVDAGRPLLCGEGIEHIDPMAFDDPGSGRRLLYWGSGRRPLRVQELAADRISFASGSAPQPILFPDDRPYRSLIEAPWIVHRDGWYYLFYSGDRCCTSEPRYAVMVARATSAHGPFEDHATPILEASEHWIAPGHCALVTDDAGADWMLYHAIARSERPRGRRLFLSSVTYRDGWPVVHGPASSPAAPKAAPIPPH